MTKQVGVNVGFNFSNLRIDGQSGLEGRSTGLFGGVLDLGLNPRLGIRIEPTWMSGGAQANNYNAYWNTMDGAVFKLDYIGVPVLARYDLSAEPMHPYALGGLSFNFATKREVELTQGQQRQTVDFADVLSSFDMSVDFGAGISFPAGGNRFNLDGRAAIGLLDINNGGTVTFNGGPLAVPSTTTHTIGFRLLASYLFDLSK